MEKGTLAFLSTTLDPENKQKRTEQLSNNKGNEADTFWHMKDACIRERFTFYNKGLTYLHNMCSNTLKYNLD